MAMKPKPTPEQLALPLPRVGNAQGYVHSALKRGNVEAARAIAQMSNRRKGEQK